MTGYTFYLFITWFRFQVLPKTWVTYTQGHLHPSDPRRLPSLHTKRFDSLLFFYTKKEPQCSKEPLRSRSFVIFWLVKSRGPKHSSMSAPENRSFPLLEIIINVWIISLCYESGSTLFLRHQFDFLQVVSSTWNGYLTPDLNFLYVVVSQSSVPGKSFAFTIPWRVDVIFPLNLLKEKMYIMKFDMKNEKERDRGRERESFLLSFEPDGSDKKKFSLSLSPIF